MGGIMNIIPAIDIKGGNVVQLVQGDPENVGVTSQFDPDVQADAWLEAGATRLHVVDLDAALGARNNALSIQKIVKKDAFVQVGGGIRSMLDIHKALESGIDNVIVGTQGVENPEWLKEIAGLYPDRIILAIDAKGRNVVTKGWTEETGKDVVALASDLTGCDLAGFLYTNVDKEGLMGGIDAEILRELRSVITESFIASGGFSTMDDLQAAADIGVDGVVLGMSIYTEAISLKEAIARFQ